MAGRKPPIVWSAEIKSGKIIITHRADFDAHHAVMRDGPLEIITRRPGKGGIGATEAQRSYYWPVIVAMYAVLWVCDPDEAHETLLMEYALARREPGRAASPVRTSSMTPRECENYYQWCRDAGKRYGMRIPLPRQVFTEDEL